MSRKCSYIWIIIDISLLLLLTLGLLFPFILQINKDKVLALEKKSFENTKNYWNLQYNEGLKLANQGHLDRAKKINSFILDSIPCKAQRCFLSEIKQKTYLSLADLYLLEKKHNKAIYIYKKLNDFVPKNYQYYYKQANAEYLKGDKEQSLKTLNKALAFNPDYIEAVVLKLDILHEQNKDKEYIEYFMYFKNKKKFYTKEDGKIYFANDLTVFSEEAQISIPNVLPDGEFHTYTLTLSDKNISRGYDIITDLRIDPINSLYDFEIKNVIFYKNNEAIFGIHNFTDWMSHNVKRLGNNRFDALNNDPYLFTKTDHNIKKDDYVTITMRVNLWEEALIEHQKKYNSLIDKYEDI